MKKANVQVLFEQHSAKTELQCYELNGGFYIAPYPDKSQNKLKQITINNRRLLK